VRRVDPKVYTRDYYLSDCTGYTQFKRSWGQELEPRVARIVTKIPLQPGSKVLDIGCGRGELVFWSLRHGAKLAVGIDYSTSAIALANQALSHLPNFQTRANFKTMDAKALQFQKHSFDAVFLTEVLEHLYPEEQDRIFLEINHVLKPGGFVFIHTSPARWFNNFTYPYYCYPLSSFIVAIWNLILNKNYPNILHPAHLRTTSHKIMHVNEPDYLSLRRLFSRHKFSGQIYSTNITINKPQLSWKDNLFNLLVYLSPLSDYPPFNIIWGHDFLAVLTKQ